MRIFLSILKRYCFFGLAIFVFSGCGYTTRAYVSKTGYRTIYIEPFLNKIDTTSEFSAGKRFKTYYPLLENKITNAVVDKYNFDGNLRVAKKEKADLTLKGELVSYNRVDVRSSANDSVDEYRIDLFVNIKLIDNNTEKVIWEYNNFAGDASYYTSGQFVKSETQAVDDAAKDLARRIVELTVEAW
jgi:hypothetical protein